MLACHVTQFIQIVVVVFSVVVVRAAGIADVETDQILVHNLRAVLASKLLSMSSSKLVYKEFNCGDDDEGSGLPSTRL